MKLFVSAALLATQTAAIAQPAFAAEIQREATTATGMFGGLRLRLPLGGSRAERAPRIGLTLAPTVHSVNERGTARMRIGEGVEFGFSDRRQAPALSLAGRRLGAAQEGDNRQDREHGRRNSGDTILIVGGVLLLAAAAGTIWFVTALNDSSE